MIVLFNGSYIDEKKAHIATDDRGFTLGDGVFDTLLCVDGAPQDAPAHFARLLGHAGVLRIQPAQTVAMLEEAAGEILRRNNFSKGRHALRTTLSRGPGERGLSPPDNAMPTLLMRASPAPDPAGLPPVHAVFAQGTRRNEHSPFSLIKSLQYGDSLLAMMEAKDRGANEALILNTAGHVACATTGNIFILEEDRILTPPLSDGVLDGITRATVMRTIEVKEQSLTVSRLLRAEAIYLTNSIGGVRTVSRLEDRVFDAPPLLIAA